MAKGPRGRRALKWLALSGLLAALAALLALLGHSLSLKNYLAGLGQPAGQAEPGTLAQAAGLERWREPEAGLFSELSFWSCESADFAQGYARGTLRFESAAGCPYTLVFEITAEVEGRARRVYRSPPIPPGYHLDGDKLDVPLKKGVYHASCVAYAYENDGSGPVACSEAFEIVLDVSQ